MLGLLFNTKNFSFTNPKDLYDTYNAFKFIFRCTLVKTSPLTDRSIQVSKKFKIQYVFFLSITKNFSKFFQTLKKTDTFFAIKPNKSFFYAY